MKVMITLGKNNTGRIQLSCVKSTNEGGGIGSSYSLPPFNPNAVAEIQDILRNLGVDEVTIGEKVRQLTQSGPQGMVKVADLDVPDDVLRETGFLAA